MGRWLGLFALLAAAYVLWQIRQLLLLIFAAIVAATALNLLVRRFRRMGMQRGYAVVLAVLALLGIVAIFVWQIVPPFVRQLVELAELLPLGIQQLNDWIAFLEERLPSAAIEAIPDVNRLLGELPQVLRRLLGGGLTLLSIVLNTLLVLVLTVMLLADPDPYRRGFVRLFPSFYRRRADEILVLCERALQGWLSGNLFNMAVVATLSFIGLSLLRVDLALAHALLAGLLNFIPNIGPVLSVVPPLAVALLDSGWKVVSVLGLYTAIQQFEGSFLTPWVMAQRVSLLPAVTLSAQVFFATFFGILGLLLALPLTVVAQVWVREVLIRDILDEWRSRQPQRADEVPQALPAASTDAEPRQQD